MTTPPLSIYPWEPLTSPRVLPHHLTPPANPGLTLSVQVCPGEYEPASFVIRAGDRDLEDVAIVCSDLKREAAPDELPNSVIINNQNIDIRTVKCWYQLEGQELFVKRIRKRVLVPELLLHDDNLISLNEMSRTNVVNKRELKDSDYLLPFTVGSHQYKQIWLTCHVPPDAHPGLYRGKITVRCPKLNVSASVDLDLAVLPFTLDPPRLDYAIYYRGKLSAGEKPPTLGSEDKTAVQMKAELRDIKSHGFKYATIYQSICDNGNYHFALLDDVLRLREEVGLPNSPFLFVGIKRDKWAKLKISETQKELNLLFDFLKSKNIEEIYIYGLDEAKGELLRSQGTIYDLVHRQRGKIFVACSKGYDQIAGDLIDLPIYYEVPPRSLIDKVHQKGLKIWIYHWPQGGLEDPLIYRKNYGIGLWQSGADGVCLYAYQHVFGDLWNETNNLDYKNHMMAYPTENGVIPTIQWEGMRAGINDVRYLTTLLNDFKKLHPDARGEMEKWLKKIGSLNDMKVLRKEVIKKILVLRNLKG